MVMKADLSNTTQHKMMTNVFIWGSRINANLNKSTYLNWVFHYHLNWIFHYHFITTELIIPLHLIVNFQSHNYKLLQLTKASSYKDQSQSRTWISNYIP